MLRLLVVLASLSFSFAEEAVPVAEDTGAWAMAVHQAKTDDAVRQLMEARFSLPLYDVSNNRQSQLENMYELCLSKWPTPHGSLDKAECDKIIVMYQWGIAYFDDKHKGPSLDSLPLYSALVEAGLKNADFGNVVDKSDPGFATADLVGFSDEEVSLAQRSGNKTLYVLALMKHANLFTRFLGESDASKKSEYFAAAKKAKEILLAELGNHEYVRESLVILSHPVWYDPQNPEDRQALIKVIGELIDSTNASKDDVSTKCQYIQGFFYDYIKLIKEREFEEVMISAVEAEVASLESYKKSDPSQQPEVWK